MREWHNRGFRLNCSLVSVLCIGCRLFAFSFKLIVGHLERHLTFHWRRVTVRISGWNNRRLSMSPFVLTSVIPLNQNIIGTWGRGSMPLMASSNGRSRSVTPMWAWSRMTPEMVRMPWMWTSRSPMRTRWFTSLMRMASMIWTPRSRTRDDSHHQAIDPSDHTNANHPHTVSDDSDKLVLLSEDRRDRSQSKSKISRHSSPAKSSLSHQSRHSRPSRPRSPKSRSHSRRHQRASASRSRSYPYSRSRLAIFGCMDSVNCPRGTDCPDCQPVRICQSERIH